MTPSKIFSAALTLLGFAAENDAERYPYIKDALTIFNTALLELKGALAADMEQSLTLSEKEYEALIYGTAMLLALYTGETEKQAFLSELYNGKRSGCKGEIGRVKNTVFGEE